MLPVDAKAEEDPLRLRLDFHDETVLLHEFAGTAGGVVRTRRVSANEVAHALARELDLDTGILPPGALWWAKTGSGVRVAVWREPQVTTVRLRESYGAKPVRLRLPMPGLVFVTAPGGQAPYVFAARARPTSAKDQLFHAPAYNVFASGRICVGTHAFPTDPAKVPHAFFESYFSVTHDTCAGKSRKHPKDVGALWRELEGRAAYPVDDLVEQFTVADALRLGE